MNSQQLYEKRHILHDSPRIHSKSAGSTRVKPKPKQDQAKNLLITMHSTSFDKQKQLQMLLKEIKTSNSTTTNINKLERAQSPLIHFNDQINKVEKYFKNQGTRNSQLFSPRDQYRGLEQGRLDKKSMMYNTDYLQLKDILKKTKVLKMEDTLLGQLNRKDPRNNDRYSEKGATNQENLDRNGEEDFIDVKGQAIKKDPYPNFQNIPLQTLKDTIIRSHLQQMQRSKSTLKGVDQQVAQKFYYAQSKNTARNQVMKEFQNCFYDTGRPHSRELRDSSPGKIQILQDINQTENAYRTITTAQQKARIKHFNFPVQNPNILKNEYLQQLPARPSMLQRNYSSQSMRRQIRQIQLNDYYLKEKKIPESNLNGALTIKRFAFQELKVAPMNSDI